MIDARLQLHWAAQAAASVGRTLLSPKPDESHQSFSWSERHHALVQSATSDGVFSGIRLGDLTLLLLRDDAVEAEFPLDGKTLADAFAFYEHRLGRTLVRPSEGLPPHPVSDGAPFNPSAADLSRLDHLYAHAATLLQAFVVRHREAGPVRLWPHHFDIATLAGLGGGKTIGAGFVAGDAEIAEPYWYVTPWPYPKETSSLPLLTNGRWHTDGWVGAVLPNGDFLDEAYDHCVKLLG
jgi:hypothetical protein